MKNCLLIFISPDGLISVHFVKTIETSVGRLNFYFNKIVTASGEQIHIAVIEKNKLLTVLMEKHDYTWKILNFDKCPEWIRPLESLFITEITAYQAGV